LTEWVWKIISHTTDMMQTCSIQCLCIWPHWY